MNKKAKILAKKYRISCKNAYFAEKYLKTCAKILSVILKMTYFDEGLATSTYACHSFWNVYESFECFEF